MLGLIGLEGVRVACLIGCQPEEWKIQQELLIDLKVEASVSVCLESDNIKDTISYVRLSEICSEIAKSKPHHLIETLAHAIIQQIVKEFAPISIWIKIRKKPKILINIDYSTVELTWKKQ